jgi:hypothetical protein
MAGYSNQDQMLESLSVNGQGDLVMVQKNISVAQVAGTWTDLGVFAGIPVAEAYAGTSGTFVPTDDTSTGAIWHGGNVSPATKHMLNAGGNVIAAAGAPWYILCVDQVGYVPFDNAASLALSAKTITMTALDGSARYPNGAGLRMLFSGRAAFTAGGPNLQVTYTNQAGTAGRVLPVTVGCNATPVQGQVLHTGNAANRYAPFLPMASGDSGIRDLESLTLSAGTAYTGAGTSVLSLVKPLFRLPLPASGMHQLGDFINTMPSLRRIKDGAFLKFYLMNTGATTAASPFLADFDYGWN